MQDQIAQVLYYVKGALKNKWLALIVAWIVCVSAWIFVAVMPNKYISEAKVHVETKTMLQPLLQGMTVQSDVRGLLRVMQLLMFTQDNLEQIIKLSDLNKSVKNEAERRALMAKLKKDIKINGGAEDIFTINYEAENPDTAKNVVQAVLTVFSDQTHMSTLTGADVAQRFIDEQIQEYETRLRNAEKARENFKRANLGLLPGQGGDQIGQIQQMTTALEDAKLSLKEAISRKEALQEQLDEALVSEDDDEWGGSSGSQSTPDDGQIAVLTQRKNELLLKYTANHPEVVHIDKTIKELEIHRDEILAKAEDAGGGLDEAMVTNPYAQTIKVALNEADANIASIHSRVDIYQSRLEKAQDEINTRLTIETEIQNLNRDYDAIKSNYSRLIESREQARMSSKVDDQAEALKFRIADAPNTPLKPASPNRKLLYSAILAGGGILGFGMSFLLYFIRPTIMSTVQLTEITGLPVLGSVSMKINAAQAKKIQKEMIGYSLTGFGLIFIYFCFMSIEFFEMKIPSLSVFL